MTNYEEDEARLWRAHARDQYEPDYDYDRQTEERADYLDSLVRAREARLQEMRENSK